MPARKELNGIAKHPDIAYNIEDRVTGQPTYGGYSEKIIVNENFVLKVQQNLDYHPVLHYFVQESQLNRHSATEDPRRSIVTNNRTGALGHIAVKFSMAMGARLAVFLCIGPGSCHPV